MNPLTVFRDDLWDVFDRFSKDFDLTNSNAGSISPRIEVKDDDKSYHLCAEIPGMNEKDINVTLKDKHLIIEGEKKNESKEEDKKKGIYHSEISYGRFYRAIPLSEDVDTEKVNATYKNGVLNIEIGKQSEKSNKTKKIEIKH